MAEHGIWKVAQGKGDRVYITCDDESKLMHPDQICDANGMGIYGFDQLQDLAVAILKFEKKRFEDNNIISKVEG